MIKLTRKHKGETVVLYLDPSNISAILYDSTKKGNLPHTVSFKAPIFDNVEKINAIVMGDEEYEDLIGQLRLSNVIND